MTRFTIFGSLVLVTIASPASAEDTLAGLSSVPIAAAPTELMLSGMLTDRVVFQRDCDAAIYGTAKANDDVTSRDASVILQDVLVGEV